MYGKVKVSLEKNSLVLRLSSHLVSDLIYWHYNTFRAVCRDRVAEERMGPTFVTFGINSLGTVSEMNMSDMLTFKRIPDSKSGEAK
jgi:hypothetical protein